MRVLKFGGTSLGSFEGMLQVKSVVSSCDEKVIVVVSALSGVTDMLLSMARMAVSGNKEYLFELNKMMERHYALIDKVVASAGKEDTLRKAEELFCQLTDILQGISLIKDLSDKTNSVILSYGERLSALIVHGMIEGSVYYDSRAFIKTNTDFKRHVVDTDLTETLIRDQFADLKQVSIVPGFIASDAASGDTTNLGRGGSDYTAALLAAVLDASRLEIWTDVDGFMTADPKVINNAYVIERLTFVEAMELCNFGAKVIYPPTIFPAFHKNIPIIIKNTYNPQSPGTYISKDKQKKDGQTALIKGISSINDTCLITVQGLGMVGVIGVNYRIFKALAKSGISVFFVSQAASENTTSIGVRNADADLAVKVLTEEFAKEIEMGEINKMKVLPNLATVAIVGENMKHTPGIAGKLFDTLGRNGIDVVAIAQGAGQTNISFIVDLESLHKTLSVIHDSFFLSEYQVLNIFLAGVGLVGGNLLEQIRLQQEKLREENALEIRIVGITNSRKFITDRNGIDINNYRELLAGSDNASSPEKFRDQIISMNIFNSVFVDCTASSDVAGIYKNLLEHNISVVTANKIAASSEYGRYLDLKNTARKKGIKFLFETNVGAGLPIINTINSLITSGDRILKIEAVLSGTLNFIFNEMSAEISMSRAIKMAQDAGYAEPDPRIDLSGADVIRKIVILSRESGYPIEQSDVKKSLLIPEKYFEGSVEDFWKRIPEVDAEFEARRRKLESEGKKWRFVATLNNGEASVALREVGPDSPFYHLAGSNNVILLTTERYKEHPMEIKGYGAGEGVTAAGVFADIISIANIR